MFVELEIKNTEVLIISHSIEGRKKAYTLKLKRCQCNIKWLSGYYEVL